MPTPKILSVSGSTINFVTPSLLPKVVALPEAAHGNFTASYFIFCSLA